MGFVHPHVHSDYSNYGMQDSVNRIENIIKRVKELGQKAWCLTDHNTCSGITDAYKKSKKAGLKLIPGAELYLTADLTIQQRDLSHITFWAKDYEGLVNLYKLTTEAHGNKGKNPKNYYYKSRVDIDLIRKYSKGLMCGSACLGGFLRRRVEDKVGEETVISHKISEDLLQKMLEIFPNDLFLELHTYQCEEQYKYNRQLVEMANKYNVPLIAATDAHFTWKHDADLRYLFKNTSKTQDGDEHNDDTLYLQSEDEIRENLKHLPKDIIEQSLANTQLLSDKSSVEIRFGEKHYPHFPCDDPYEEVRKQCLDAWNSDIKNSNVNVKEYGSRIKTELEVLKHQEYCSYFLITADYLKDAEKNGIPIGPGRGSAVASEVAHIIGITKLDPIVLNLTFERFAHNERIAPADIDVDVSRKHRSRVIDYIRSKYGEVYQVRTFQVIGAKGAIHRAGMALNWTQEDINILSESISKYEPNDEDGEELSTYEQKLWILDHVRNDSNTELIDLAKRFVGIIAGYGKHASAVLILDKDIEQFCSIERQNDSKTNEPSYIAACSYPLLEDQGLMKADVLGLKTLDVIHDTIELSGESININEIPLDDLKTSQMLCEGATSGCFQIESPGMTQLVKYIQPKGFVDLIPLVALYRPGPLGAIVEETGDTMVKTYINVKSGKIKAQYLHPKLKPILENTYSIILYQEQILEIAKELCGYSLGEADNLRRIIGKKKIDEMQPAIDQMIQRGINNGISRDVMDKITKQIIEFASYCFNKGHSAAYGLLSYQTAYLKAHYPLQFMCATINSEANIQEKIIPYINECRRLGIHIIPPDIRLKNREWIMQDNSLVIGLHYIHGIGKNLKLDNIDNLNDIFKYNAKNVNIGLIKSGALDSFGVSRKDMLETVLEIEKNIQKYNNSIVTDEHRITELIEENEARKDKTTKAYAKNLEQIENRKKNIVKSKKKLIELQNEQKELNKFDIIAAEVSALGFSFYKIPEIKKGKCINIHTKKDKNQKLMAWATFDTPYGEYRATIFAYMWQKLSKVIKEGQEYYFVIDDGKILKDVKPV